MAVRQLAGRGALVKRLSAVETLGSTDVICTDKTGTLTENRMIPVAAWVPLQRIDLEDGSLAVSGSAAPSSVQALGRIAANCNNARLNAKADPAGDPTEIAILIAARMFGADSDHERREAQRRWQFHFDPERKLMSTVDQLPGASTVVHTKGAPEAVVSLCSQILDTDRHPVVLDDPGRRRVEAAVNAFAAEGLRVLAFAWRELAADEPVPKVRGDAERDLCFTGLIALLDPPRAGVADAVAQCRTAGIRIIMITGDHALTAGAIAQRVGITGDHPTVVTGDEFERLAAQKSQASCQLTSGVSTILEQPHVLSVSRAVVHQ